MFERLRATPEFQSLIDASRRLGADPLQVQGPGGNTSLKDGGAMWIKASGTWLAWAGNRDIFVPCEVGVLRRALEDGRDQPDLASVVPAAANPLGLRPSIETAVHAALDWPVVLHTHCVATIALAIRRDGPDRIRSKLPEIEVAFVPYVKPGWDLARAIREAISPATQVVILGNHGLVVCGPNVARAEALLREVSAALEPATMRDPMAMAPGFAERLRGTGWTPAPMAISHAVARDPARLKKALGGTLYPDHLIFLGPGARPAPDGRAPADGATDGAPCKMLLFPGEGMATPEDATPAELAMARCLGDVLARVPDGADVLYLTDEDEAALMNWDAEKYRQVLNRAAS